LDFSEFEEGNTRYQIHGAMLYVGGTHANAPLSPTLCVDPNYVKMRLERIGSKGTCQVSALQIISYA
jgi:hypothetical protein